MQSFDSVQLEMSLIKILFPYEANVVMVEGEMMEQCCCFFFLDYSSIDDLLHVLFFSFLYSFHRSHQTFDFFETKLIDDFEAIGFACTAESYSNIHLFLPCLLLFSGLSPPHYESNYESNLIEGVMLRRC